MSKTKAHKTASLPENVCKTNIISIGSNQMEDVRQRSSTWHGVETPEASQKSTNSLLKIPQRKTEKNSMKKYQDSCEETIKLITEQVLSERLKNLDYDHDECRHICAEISKSIHDRLKNATHLCFKIVVLSFIGELMDDGIEAATQCTWHPLNDVMVTVYFKNDSLFALVNLLLTRVKETVV